MKKYHRTTSHHPQSGHSDTESRLACPHVAARLLSILALGAVLAGSSLAEEEPEVRPLHSSGLHGEDILHTIRGDRDCIKSAVRYYYTWTDYDETAHRWDELHPFRKPNRKVMWETTRHFYRQQFTDDSSEFPGTVYGADPSRDLSASYRFRWAVNDGNSWTSIRQPRVESWTQIILKEGHRATLKLTNSISMNSHARISNWGAPLRARHEVTMRAIDVLGRSHTYTHTKNATVTQRATGVWKIDQGETYSMPNLQSAPTLPDQALQNDPPNLPAQQYGLSYRPDPVLHTIEIGCDDPDGVTFGRAAQISGFFHTESLGQRVFTRGEFEVKNEIDIEVKCFPCDAPDAPEPSADWEPHFETPYGTEIAHALPPTLDRNGITYSPLFGESVRPHSLLGRPDLHNAGTLYLPSHSLPSYTFRLPASEVPDYDFPVTSDRIPLVIPDDGGPYPAGYLPSIVKIRPLDQTEVGLTMGRNRLTFDGPFTVVNPASPDQSEQFSGGYVEFPNGGSPLLVTPKPLRITIIDGHTLQDDEDPVFRSLESFAPDGSPSGNVQIETEGPTQRIVFRNGLFLANPVPSVPTWKPTITGLKHSDTQVNVQITGRPNQEYLVRTSENLIDWEAVGAATRTGPKSFEFVDPDVVGTPRRFYQVMENSDATPWVRSYVNQPFEHEIVEPEIVFSWNPYPGSSSYNLTIWETYLDEGGELQATVKPVFKQQNLSTPSFDFGEPSHPVLHPGISYAYTVTAHAEGSVLTGRPVLFQVHGEVPTSKLEDLLDGLSSNDPIQRNTSLALFDTLLGDLDVLENEESRHLARETLFQAIESQHPDVMQLLLPATRSNNLEVRFEAMDLLHFGLFLAHEKAFLTDPSLPLFDEWLIGLHTGISESLWKVEGELTTLGVDFLTLEDTLLHTFQVGFFPTVIPGTNLRERALRDPVTGEVIAVVIESLAPDGTVRARVTIAPLPDGGTMTRIDKDADGNSEEVHTEGVPLGEGRFASSVVYDDNDDGTRDRGYFDTDGDGWWDVVWRDANASGTAEEGELHPFLTRTPPGWHPDPNLISFPPAIDPVHSPFERQ